MYMYITNVTMTNAFKMKVPQQVEYSLCERAQFKIYNWVQFGKKTKIKMQIMNIKFPVGWT